MARSSQSDITNVPMAKAPEGFKRSGSANAVGWFNHGKIGNILSGKLLGMFSRKDQMREGGMSDFFQVEIDQECEVRVERGEDAKFVVAPVGSVVNVNYGPKTKNWASHQGSIERGAVWRVWGQIAGGKVKIGGGRTMHNFEVYEKMEQAPVEPADEADYTGGDEAGEGGF